MTTARELLEQADALMRRNRRSDPVVALTPTEILPEYGALPDSPEHAALPPPSEHAGLLVDERGPGGEGHDADWLATLADLPVLTDVVEVGPMSAAAPAQTVEIPTVRVAPADVAPVETPRAEVAPADVAPIDVGSVDVRTVEAQPADAAQRTTTTESAARVTEPATESAPAQASESAQASDADRPVATDWSALAEEIRAQVLQRLDLFTDTGLREQLGAHLKPLVDRASAELVDTINRQVGELVRSYVAEAIEREIEAWRDRKG